MDGLFKPPMVVWSGFMMQRDSGDGPAVRGAVPKTVIERAERY